MALYRGIINGKLPLVYLHFTLGWETTNILSIQVNCHRGGNDNSHSFQGFPGADPVSDEARRKRKLIAQAALSGRSFSSPNGQLDMHYLRKALAKVSTAKSYNWSVGGRMNDIGHESQQFQADSSSRKSLNDSSKFSKIISNSMKLRSLLCGFSAVLENLANSPHNHC